MTQSKKHLYTAGGTNQDIPPDIDRLCIMFNPKELRSGAVGRGVDDLMVLSDSPHLSRQLAHGVSLWFDGYGQDSREIPMISEVRLYIQALHAQWPYWMHFLSPNPDMWALLMLSLMQSTQMHRASDGQMSYLFDKSELDRLITEMGVALNHLHDFIELDDVQSDRLLHGSVRAIERCMVAR